MEELEQFAKLAEKLYESYDTPPPMPTHDALAVALGVHVDCTGNSDTAKLSRPHNPKSGLDINFYAVGPAHRNEHYTSRAYYQATWKGGTYRGDIVVSTAGYHSGNLYGFSCFDMSQYSVKLPEGCRKLIAGIVDSTLGRFPIGTIDKLKEEYDISARHYAVSSHLAKVHFSADDAVRAFKNGGNR